MTQQVQTYRERSREYLTKAFRELEAGDLAQASEKGWGAAAQVVKAVADERGLPHSSHALLIGMAYQLEQETGDPDMAGQFAFAQELHGNFYEGRMPLTGVEMRLRRVADFVTQLERLLPEAE